MSTDPSRSQSPALQTNNLSKYGGAKALSYLLSSRAWASRAAVFRASCVCASGLNGLPFSITIDFSMSIIALVTRQPRLDLDNAIKRLKETVVIWNGGVVDNIDGIDEFCGLRVGRL